MSEAAPQRSLVGKLVRFGWVTVVTVIVTQSVLIGLSAGLEWDGVPANIAATTAGAVPAYLLNRNWVWQRSGPHSFRREVLPFWILALIGLAFSTLVVDLVDRYTDRTVFVLLGNLAAYGIVWIAKYLFLDKIMWKHQPAVEPVEVV